MAGFSHSPTTGRVGALSPQSLQEHLVHLPLWSFDAVRGGMLRREFTFDDFAQAFGFMAQVALHAERWDHHPEWFNVYNRVSVALTTHDAGGVSVKDLEMARRMEAIAGALRGALSPVQEACHG